MGKHLSLLLLSVSVLAHGQANITVFLAQKANDAHKRQDYATFLLLEKKILALQPFDTVAMYNVACGEALTGHPADAIQVLDKLLKAHVDLNADTDPDFTSIHELPAWAHLKEGLAALRKPVVHSATAFILPDKDLTVSSIAVDERSGDTYIASVRERKILKRTKEGVISDFVTKKDGLFGVWGLLMDPARRQLIASTSAVPFMQGFQKEDEGKAGICIFDLATGKLARQAFLSGAPDQHLLTSMAEDKSGNVFVVDSKSDEIYRLRRGSPELELYISSVVFREPKGLALSADELTLYVADYLDGLWALEVLSNDRRRIDQPDDVTLAGLNGLSRVGDGFVAVQNALQPNRVVRIHLDANAARVTSVETLDSNLPNYAGPLQGTVSSGDFLYIANGQIGLGDFKTGAFADDKAQPTTVLRLPLGK
jgi:sugar lactone lactonase YvrE